MKTITTSKGEFVAVELPNGHIAYEFNGKYYDLESGKEICESKHFKLICKLSEAKEEDAKGVVYYEETFDNFGRFISGYRSKHCLHTSAIDSLHSLLKSKGIDINNSNCYLFEKLK